MNMKLPISDGQRLTTGAARVDSRIGGLMRAAVHEVFAKSSADASAAAGFSLMLALRSLANKPIFWIRDDRNVHEIGQLSALGLIELGLNPAAICLVHARTVRGVLQAGADSVNSGAVGTVIIEPWGRAPELGLTESRRLALAAARSGVLTLILRAGADPGPSAATTRWGVQTAPSHALAANAPGHPAFDISLLRHRGGIAGFDAQVEWDSDLRSFRDTPLSRVIPAVFADRADDPRERRAA